MGLFQKWWSLEQPESNRALGLETPVQYKERWISIRVFYCLGFLIYFTFYAVITGLWPYLKILDPEADKKYLTYILALPSIVQLIFSPLLGWWSNRISSVRIPVLVSLMSFIVGHVIYAIMEDIPVYRKEILLISRGMAGMVTAASAINRAYISSATTVAERTGTVSRVNFCNTLGLLAGSAFQPILSLMGKEGFHFLGFIRLNMFSTIGWIGAIIGSTVFALMMPCVFKENHIAVKEAMMKNEEAMKDGSKLPVEPLRYQPIVLSIVAFTFVVFVQIAVQCLLSPIALDQFGWTNEESLFYLGILMTVGALISCVLFLLLDPLCKRFGESNVLVYGAMFALFLSQLMLIPFGSEPITSVTEVGNLTELHNSTTVASGCPLTQEWCQRIPPISKVQFTISYTLLCVSFSIGTTLSQAVFSKLLGPRPQGTWMALLTCAGSAARILGPGSVTLYVLFGTYWTFGAGSVLAGLVFIWMWVYRNTLQPAKPVVPPEMAEELKVLNSKNIVQ
ncbi:major facilitator superfamily domain-containing protein 8-like isoform X1 [Armigeres subalbatus]|uniref:major facilitator superfamily domain-containing protein 8-like isoform X1 n=1 Tax=Armigeres subalbatus TaxID=124917 RepID=UPI002ED5AC44